MFIYLKRYYIDANYVKILEVCNIISLNLVNGLGIPHDNLKKKWRCVIIHLLEL
jgi:hypothetical protein